VQLNETDADPLTIISPVAGHGDPLKAIRLMLGQTEHQHNVTRFHFSTI